MDPFSITVGALGITSFALSSISGLREFIEGISEARDLVEDIAANLRNIEGPLEALRELDAADDAARNRVKDILEKVRLAETVNDCGGACDEFTKKLKQWTANSSASHISLRDRFTVGVLRKEKIRTFRTRVETCASRVQLGVSVAMLVIQVRSGGDSRRHGGGQQREAITVQSQAEEQLAMMLQRLEIAGRQEQALRSTAEVTDDYDAESIELKSAIEEVRKQIGLLEASQNSLGTILKHLDRGRSTQDIQKVVTAKYSKAVVGYSDGLGAPFDQRIWDVSTTEGSSSMVGNIGGNVRLDNFFDTTHKSR